MIFMLLSFFASTSWALVPVPIDSSSDTAAITANFMDLASEVKRNSLINGGTVNSTVTFNAGIKFGDSTTQTTGYKAANSTFTTFQGVTTTQGSMIVCQATVTLPGVTSGNRVMVNLTGTFLNAQLEDQKFGIMVDGGFESPYSSTVPLFAGRSNLGDQPLGIHYLTQSTLSAGTHNFCVAGARGTLGTLEICPSPSYCQFSAVEVH